MQSHWGIHQPTFQAAEESIPEIIKYAAEGATTKMPQTPLRKMAKRIFPDVFSASTHWRKLKDRSLKLFSLNIAPVCTIISP